jgi:hypothetical protein
MKTDQRPLMNVDPSICQTAELYSLLCAYARIFGEDTNHLDDTSFAGESNFRKVVIPNNKREEFELTRMKAYEFAKRYLSEGHDALPYVIAADWPFPTHHPITSEESLHIGQLNNSAWWNQKEEVENV